MPIQTAQPLEANGRTISVIGWDPQNHQFVLLQAGAGSGDSIGTFTDGPLIVNQLVGTSVYATTTLAAATGGNVTLAGATGKFTYINGFYVCIGHATGAITPGQVTLSLDGGTTTHMNFTVSPSTAIPGLVSVVFPDPIPAVALNTGIKITVPTITNAGAGSISAFGYQL